MLKIEERQIKMPYGVESAYHCQKCGGITDEYGKCYYCHSENKIRYKEPEALQMYIEIDGERKFYFNHVNRMMDICVEPQTIDITTLSDYYEKPVIKSVGYGRFSLDFLITEDSMFKANMMGEQEKPITLNIVSPQMPKSMRMRVEDVRIQPTAISPYEVSRAEASMAIHDMDGWITPTFEAPDDARCPNCGAIVRKTYGVCDYCGGWVEYR